MFLRRRWRTTDAQQGREGRGRAWGGGASVGRRVAKARALIGVGGQAQLLARVWDGGGVALMALRLSH